MSTNHEPAFPGTHLDPEVRKALLESPAGYGAAQAERIASYHGGMSLRDWLAGKALPAVISNQHAGAQNPTLTDLSMAEAAAGWAYLYADAMLKARNQP